MKYLIIFILLCIATIVAIAPGHAQGSAIIGQPCGAGQNGITATGQAVVCQQPAGGGAYVWTVPGGITFPLAAPNGLVSAPSYNFTNQTNTGFYLNSSIPEPMFAQGGTDVFRYQATGNAGIIIASGSALGWATNIQAGSSDTGISRSAAGVVAVGNGANGSTTGALKLAGVISVGTQFTTNNGCTDGANAGGASAGYFIVGSTSCTEVVTMGNGLTAPNGWSCTVVDITTLADVTNPHQTTSNTTTATFVTGTVASGDKIQFSCTGY